MEEKMVGLIAVLKKPKSFGRWDTFSLIVTSQRLIFAQLTPQLLKDAAMEAQRKGKQEGKGFLSRWADQIKAASTFSERYWNVPPEEILHENTANFTIQNQDLKSIEIKKKSHTGWSQETEQTFTEIKICSTNKKEKYNIDGYSANTSSLLKDVLGDKVKT